MKAILLSLVIAFSGSFAFADNCPNASAKSPQDPTGSYTPQHRQAKPSPTTPSSQQNANN